MTPCQKLLKQEGTARRIESMQQSSATLSLHLWFLGVAEDCCMLSILLAVPSCFNSFWHGVIPTSYFIFNDFFTLVYLWGYGQYRLEVFQSILFPPPPPPPPPHFLQVLSLSPWGGVLRPYSNNLVVDRFFLGGGTTLRGFDMWGVGPRENGIYVS